MSQEQMGVRRTALTLLRVNQPTGFDCPGCAWPDPGHTHTAEFCENGAKAVAEEATLRRVDRDFFAEHCIEDLAGRTDYWLGQQGRLAEPMYRPAGADHYEPIDWEGAFALIAERLHALPNPGCGGVLHLGPHVQRGRLPLPADGAPLRHQQPARLLQHVPRVERGRAGALDRHRQGIGAAGGHLRRRPDHGRRPEPRHQPPADALGAGAGEEERRLHRQHQPARRGRTAHASTTRRPRRGLPRARTSPTTSCRCASPATRPCSRRWRS